MMKFLQKMVVILVDRHQGIYSGGKFIAIANPLKLVNNTPRIIHLLARGPFEGYGGAMNFWMDPPKWVASGDTPEEAEKNLKNGIQPFSWDKF